MRPCACRNRHLSDLKLDVCFLLSLFHSKVPPGKYMTAEVFNVKATGAYISPFAEIFSELEQTWIRQFGSKPHVRVSLHHI